MAGSCGAFCSFCGKCGKKAGDVYAELKVPEVAPPGSKAVNQAVDASIRDNVAAVKIKNQSSSLQ